MVAITLSMPIARKSFQILNKMKMIRISLKTLRKVIGLTYANSKTPENLNKSSTTTKNKISS